jgi:hypothetical protein
LPVVHWQVWRWTDDSLVDADLIAKVSTQVTHKSLVISGCLLTDCLRLQHGYFDNSGSNNEDSMAYCGHACRVAHGWDLDCTGAACQPLHGVTAQACNLALLVTFRVSERLVVWVTVLRLGQLRAGHRSHTLRLPLAGTAGFCGSERQPVHTDDPVPRTCDSRLVVPPAGPTVRCGRAAVSEWPWLEQPAVVSPSSATQAILCVACD